MEYVDSPVSKVFEAHISELSSLRSQLEYWNTGFWENGTMGELVLDKVKDWQYFS